MMMNYVSVNSMLNMFTALVLMSQKKLMVATVNGVNIQPVVKHVAQVFKQEKEPAAILTLKMEAMIVIHWVRLPSPKNVKFKNAQLMVDMAHGLIMVNAVERVVVEQKQDIDNVTTQHPLMVVLPVLALRLKQPNAINKAVRQAQLMVGIADGLHTVHVQNRVVVEKKQELDNVTIQHQPTGVLPVLGHHLKQLTVTHKDVQLSMVGGLNGVHIASAANLVELASKNEQENVTIQSL